MEVSSNTLVLLQSETPIMVLQSTHFTSGVQLPQLTSHLQYTVHTFTVCFWGFRKLWVCCNWHDFFFWWRGRHLGLLVVCFTSWKERENHKVPKQTLKSFIYYFLTAKSSSCKREEGKKKPNPDILLPTDLHSIHDSLYAMNQVLNILPSYLTLENNNRVVLKNNILPSLERMQLLYRRFRTNIGTNSCSASYHMKLRVLSLLIFCLHH